MASSMDMVLCDTTTFCGCGSQRRSKLEQDPLSQWSLLERPVDAQRTSHITQDRHAAEQEVPRQYHRGKDLHPTTAITVHMVRRCNLLQRFQLFAFQDDRIQYTPDKSSPDIKRNTDRHVGMSPAFRCIILDISLPQVVASSFQSIVANKTLTSKPYSFLGRTDHQGSATVPSQFSIRIGQTNPIAQHLAF